MTPKGGPLEQIVHAVRRDLFYIDSGRKKTKRERELHLPDVQKRQTQSVRSNVVRVPAQKKRRKVAGSEEL